MLRSCSKCLYHALPGIQIHRAKGEVLFLEDTPLNWVYRIVTGTLKMVKDYENGGERILGVLSDGDDVALLAALQGKDHYIANAIAMTDVILVQSSKEEVLSTYRSYPDYREMCMGCALSRSHFFQFQTAQSSELDVNQKIIAMLQNLALKYGRKEGSKTTLLLPFTKTVLADLIGIRRETLSRHLGLLQDQGKIKVDGNRYVLENA